MQLHQHPPRFKTWMPSSSVSNVVLRLWRRRFEAVQARKAAGLAAGNLNYKSPPPRQDMVAKMMALICASDKRDDGMMSDV